MLRIQHLGKRYRTGDEALKGVSFTVPDGDVVGLSGERDLPTIINIHDVVLAQQFVQRIIGLRAGEVVFDGPPGRLDDQVLTRIYGEEDWTAMCTQAEEDAREAVDAAAQRMARKERRAGMA